MLVNLPRRTRLITLGVIILLAGGIAAGVLYRRGLQNDVASDDDVLALQEQSNAYDQEVQRNVGPVGALMAHGSENLAKLGQPKPLAIIIVVVCGLAAGGLFRSASRRSDAPGEITSR